MTGLMKHLAEFEKVAHALGNYLNELEEYTEWRKQDERAYISETEVRSEEYRRRYADDHFMLDLPDPELMESLEWDYSMRDSHARSDQVRSILQRFHAGRTYVQTPETIQRAAKIDLWELTCPGCGKAFYELDSATLESCPHCGESADVQESGAKKTVLVDADPKAGFIRAVLAD